jgi:hypothetical protein
MHSGGVKPTFLLYTVTVTPADAALPDGVFFNRPGVVVMKWHPTLRAVCVEWQGWADPVEFAAAFEAGLGALVEHRSSRWLADCRDMKTIQQSDQEWLDKSWFPRALAAGLRRMAVVAPRSGLALTNLEDIMGRVPASKMQVVYLATVGEAETWLVAPSITTPTTLEAQKTL